MYIMYYQVTQNNLRCLNHTRGGGGGDTRQILDNLRKEDNLRREDKDCGPKVSSVRRFYCTCTNIIIELKKGRRQVNEKFFKLQSGDIGMV